MKKGFEFYVIDEDIREMCDIINANNAWIIGITGKKLEAEAINDLYDWQEREKIFKRDEFFIVNNNSSLKYIYEDNDNYFAFPPDENERYVLDVGNGESFGFLYISFGHFANNINMNWSGYIVYDDKLETQGGIVIAQPKEYGSLFRKLKKQITQNMIKDECKYETHYMGKHCHEEYLKGNFKPDWWEEPSTNTNTVIDAETVKSETSVIPADIVSDESDDIAVWLHEYTENDNLEIRPVTCHSCGSDNFEIIADQDEGAIQVKCTKCGEEKLLLDSEEIWEETEPEQMVCPECGEGIEFNVKVGFSRREEGGDVDWVYIGSKCTKCGAISSFLDWEIDYGPTDEMEQNL